jgi:cytochrome P450
MCPIPPVSIQPPLWASSAPKPATALRRFDDLPGPPGWRLMANLLGGRACRIHLLMEAWSRRYGSLFGVKLGTQRLLVVADHETIVAVLRDRPDVFRRASKLQEVNEELGGAPGLFDSEAQAWRDQRRMVMASFAPHHVRAFFPFLLSGTQRLHAGWQRAAIAGRAIDLQADLKRYAVEVIASLAFGDDVGSLESTDDPIQRHLDIVFAGTYRRLMSPLPYWRWLRLPGDRQLERSVAALKIAIAAFIARAHDRIRADPDRRHNPRNLLEAMIAATEAEDAGAVDERHVAGNVSTMLFAGEDTTANTLAWLIYLLARHPLALLKAREETRRLAPELAQLGPEQLERLVYLDACINEAMRLKPVAPFLVVEALCDTTVADVAVPAATMVWCAMRHDNLAAGHFANPGDFDPQRWLMGGDKRVSMPFGAGPAHLPGALPGLARDQGGDGDAARQL